MNGNLAGDPGDLDEPISCELEHQSHAIRRHPTRSHVWHCLNCKVEFAELPNLEKLNLPPANRAEFIHHMLKAMEALQGEELD